LSTGSTDSTDSTGLPGADHLDDSAWCPDQACASVVVTDYCEHGLAKLSYVLSDITINGRDYDIYAQYLCLEPAWNLVSYWEEGTCGFYGNDYNINWCPSTYNTGECPSATTDLCPGGSARLVYILTDLSLNGCYYLFWAQYECESSSEDIIEFSMNVTSQMDYKLILVSQQGSLNALGHYSPNNPINATNY